MLGTNLAGRHDFDVAVRCSKQKLEVIHVDVAGHLRFRKFRFYPLLRDIQRRMWPERRELRVQTDFSPNPQGKRRMIIGDRMDDYSISESVEYQRSNWWQATIIAIACVTASCGCRQETNDRTLKAADLIDRGNAHFERNEYDEAIALFSEAIRIEPDNYRGYLSRSHVFMELYDHEKETADLTEVIKLKPDAESYRNRGSSYLSAKDYDRAIADLTESVRLEPDFIAAYETRGFAHYLNRNYQLAIPDFTRVIEARPTDFATYARRAECHEKVGNVDQAAADRLKASGLGHH